MTTLDQNAAADTASAGADTATAGADTAERMIGILNDGAIVVLGAIGHQTGLFDAMAALPAATSQQVADAAGLHERYVREWLGGVVAAGWADYDANAGTYALRADYVPFLTGTGVDNIARTMGLITLMGQVTPLVVDRFREGGRALLRRLPRLPRRPGRGQRGGP
jgi:Rv2258c-like winged HTH domain